MVRRSHAAEVPLELEAFHRHMVRSDRRKQLAQAGNIPLAVRKLKQRTAVGLQRIFVEHFVEAAASGKQVERLVEDQKWLGQRIDDRKRERLRLGEVRKLIDRDAPSNGERTGARPPAPREGMAGDESHHRPFRRRRPLRLDPG
jgi:hypothetical protein